MTEEARKRLITWGVDGYGQKWYLCRCCRKEFGGSSEIDYWDIDHKCKEDEK